MTLTETVHLATPRLHGAIAQRLIDDCAAQGVWRYVDPLTDKVVFLAKCSQVFFSIAQSQWCLLGAPSFYAVSLEVLGINPADNNAEQCHQSWMNDVTVDTLDGTITATSLEGWQSIRFLVVENYWSYDIVRLQSLQRPAGGINVFPPQYWANLQGGADFYASAANLFTSDIAKS